MASELDKEIDCWRLASSNFRRWWHTSDMHMICYVTATM